jgi:hypothetical protein
MLRGFPVGLERDDHHRLLAVRALDFSVAEFLTMNKREKKSPIP